MTIPAAIVLFAVVWFLVLFVILPLGVRTQGEEGSVTRGTPASAPANAMIPRKLRWTTLIALMIWGAIVGVILWSGLTIRDIDFWGRM